MGWKTESVWIEIVMRGPTASFSPRIDLEIVEKDVFNISILKMPVARVIQVSSGIAYRGSLEMRWIYRNNMQNTPHSFKVFSEMTKKGDVNV